MISFSPTKNIRFAARPRPFSLTTHPPIFYDALPNLGLSCMVKITVGIDILFPHGTRSLTNAIAQKEKGRRHIKIYLTIEDDIPYKLFSYDLKISLSLLVHRSSA